VLAVLRVVYSVFPYTVWNISIFFADNGLVTNSKLCRPHLRP
jgi:hypothetical protein